MQGRGTDCAVLRRGVCCSQAGRLCVGLVVEKGPGGRETCYSRLGWIGASIGLNGSSEAVGTVHLASGCRTEDGGWQRVALLLSGR